MRVCFAQSQSPRSDTITVINTNDSGPGSLRQALAVVNDGDSINFDPALNGQTITLTTAELLINRSITVMGPGANLLTVARAQNAPAFRIFDVVAGLTVMIQGITISNGSAQFGCGGGILAAGSTLSVTNCTVSNNSTGGTGGGICAENNATITIESSTLSDNYAGDYGGGMANDGTITINNSTLRDNRGEFAAGAILNGFTTGASLTVSNSTLSGNTTQLHGGGIFNGGQAVITDSTLNGNSGMNGGAIVNRLGTLEMKNTVLNRGDLGPNILNDTGTVTSHGYNLCDDDCSGVLNGPGDQVNTEPLLGPLQDNGGPTLTHALLPGSPAIDAGDPNFSPPPFFDQRGPGFDRVVSGRIDKGSFELHAGTTPTPTPTCTPRFFINPAPIIIPDSGPASPYPSNIVVAAQGTVVKVTVTLRSLIHFFPDDLDFLLVGPAGQNAIIWSDAGGEFDILGVDVTLDDDASNPLPDNAQIVTGMYRPANYGAGDTWPAPAPTPLGGSALSIFNGTDPNGTWRLYLVDDAGGNNGVVDGGWILRITTTCPSPTPTSTPTTTATPTATPTPTATATTTATATATPTSTPTATSTATATSTPRPTPTPRGSPAPRPRPTPAPRP